jgi:RimJ/RimL family protein N-acetyltransferase
MKTKVTTKICEGNYILRTASKRDAEILRQWKNDHREFFFYKQEISKEEQEKWIDSLENRENDHMFIIMDDNKPVGSVGTRLYQEFVDIYNVILGDKSYKGKHVMTDAVWATVAFSNLVFVNKPVRVRVLRTNPAIKWYEKIGFNTIDYFDDHIFMQFRNQDIKTRFDFNIDITLPII